ncbi:MAG: hypothetical protein QG604_694 [Candidatus Dependentiae bacterium]|nr:hypothetical protein [Candidatus Dependentiae bacterium]
MIIHGISINPLLKAQENFELFRQDMVTDRDHAGAIQAYEYCFELAWKTMKRVLEARGQIANSPREAFRLAAREGFIDNPEIWFDFMKERNRTVHCYDREVLDEVISYLPQFSEELQKFLVNLAKLGE